MCDLFQKIEFSEIITKDSVIIVITDAAKKRPHLYCMCPNVDMIHWKNENGIFQELLMKTKLIDCFQINSFEQNKTKKQVKKTGKSCVKIINSNLS